MKDLKRTDRVTVWTPDAQKNAPIRMTLEGSDDGRLWFRLAATQPDPKTLPVVPGEAAAMSARIYDGVNADRVHDLGPGRRPDQEHAKATAEGKAADLFWTRQPDDKAKRPTVLSCGTARSSRRRPGPPASPSPARPRR